MKCKVRGCNRPAQAKGLCSVHYYRKRNGGLVGHVVGRNNDGVLHFVGKNGTMCGAAIVEKFRLTPRLPGDTTPLTFCPKCLKLKRQALLEQREQLDVALDIIKSALANRGKTVALSSLDKERSTKK